MKLLNILLCFTVIGIILSSCSKNDDGPVDPPVAFDAASLFYPGGIGSSFTFRIDTLNASSSAFDSIGTRATNFASSQMVDNQQIFTQLNTVTQPDSVVNSDLQFWRTDNGVYFVVDTSGLNDLLDELLAGAAIPDSILQQLSFNIDSRITAVAAPLELGKPEWTAFRLYAVINVSGLEIPILEVKAIPAGKESVFIPQLGANREAEKINYRLIISIPDLTTLTSQTTEFPATGWFVKDIGLVKLQGIRLLINALSSGDINFADTSTVARETLLGYQLM